MRAAHRFGDVAYLKIGPRRDYLITNPADGRHVLQDNARNYHKSPLYQKLKMFLGNGLLTSEDEFWLRQRRIAQPAFHRQRNLALAGVMAEPLYNGLQITAVAHICDRVPTGELVGTVVIFYPVMGERAQ